MPRTLVLVSALLAVAICGRVGTQINFEFDGLIPKQNSHSQKNYTCSVSNWKVESAETSVFASLTVEEYKSVEAFMESIPELQLTHSLNNSRLDENTIHWIEWYYPPKQEVLEYLDSNGKFPGRWARVIVYRGSVPDVVEYKVGPLPNPTTYELIEYPRPTAWNARINTPLTDYYLEMIAFAFTEQIKDVIRESFGGFTFEEDCEKCLIFTDSAPGSLDPNDKRQWFWFIKDVDGPYLHPVGLELLISYPGTDASTWKVVQFAYNNIVFTDIAEFLEAYQNGTVPKIRYNENEDLSWSSLYPTGAQPESDKKVPPRHFEPEGHRWKLVGENKIEYMDWTFEFAIVPTSGLHIFDARYKGDRILYELGLKEAYASYSGYNPIQTSSVYLDGSWGLGTYLQELIPGADCPYNAEYFNYTYWSEEPITITNSICIFEQDVAYPARRHFSSDFAGSFTSASSSPTYSLVIRTASTPFNYDYVFDYIFYANGLVETRVALSGYLQATHYYDGFNEDNYATRIHEQSVGSLHDHIMGFKIDLDVLGTANTFELQHVDKETIKTPFHPYPITQKKLTKEIIETDDHGGVHMNFERPTFFVVKSNEVNKWGHARSYRIDSNHPIKSIIGDDIRAGGGAFTKYQVAVTKQKDSENYISSHFCQDNPVLCPYTIDDYLDGDNIVNEDLVIWATLGVVHLPGAEDYPVTETLGHTASLFIRPFNYFNEDPAMNVRAGVLYRRDNAEGSLQTDFRIKEVEPCIAENNLPQYNGNDVHYN